jgi:hypothetical protein
VLVLWILHALPFGTPLLVYFGWDPAAYTLNYLFPSSSIDILITKLFLRLLGCAFGGLVLTRTISLVWIFLVTLAKGSIECILLQHSNSIHVCKLSSYLNSLREHELFLLFFNSFAQKFLSNNLSAGIAIGMTAGICLNFVSLRMYSVIPMPTFLFFPIASVLVIVGVSLWFPYGIMANDMFSDIIRNRLLQINAYPIGYRKLLLKKIISIKPGAAGCMVGDTMVAPFHRSTQTAYFRKQLDYTISACLSIPVQ